MSERRRRQELILTLIAEKPVRTQDDLLSELTRRGLSLTQPTLSRELKSLGVAKAPDGRGGYRYLTRTATGEGPLPAVATFVRSVARAQNLLVVKTPPGNAQGVAREIDQVEWPEVMGTIAGDDTILIICHDGRQASRVERLIGLIRRG
ncbi:MAG: arginine repressor [Acidobacteriota bacterium]